MRERAPTADHDNHAEHAHTGSAATLPFLARLRPGTPPQVMAAVIEPYMARHGHEIAEWLQRVHGNQVTQAVLRAAQTHAVAATIKSMTGEVHVVRGGRELAPAQHMALHATDVVVTGATGRITVVLGDGTRVAMSHDQRSSIAELAEDNAHNGESLTKKDRGALGVVSKEIARDVDGEKARTPTSILGWRG